MTNPTHLDLYVTQWLGSIGPTHNSPDARNLLFIVAPSGSDYTTEGFRRQNTVCWYIPCFKDRSEWHCGGVRSCYCAVFEEKGLLSGTAMEEKARASCLSEFQQAFCDVQERGTELIGQLVRTSGDLIQRFVIGGEGVPSTVEMLLACVLWFSGLATAGLRLSA
ncbi:hypothetical protein BDW74DRAFT_148958 [Aspergillus multicolor]|uniref:uncharacterized protein n=1 Tax=Aspergillus multicolor TaxID=41759 RepID=UPI003CCDD985